MDNNIFISCFSQGISPIFIELYNSLFISKEDL